MTRNVEGLRDAYANFVALPWSDHLSGAERVWIAIYTPSQERRLRMRVQEFETATMQTQHRWKLHDITDAFPEWLSAHEYRDTFFKRPSALEPALEQFGDYLAHRVIEQLVAPDVDDQTVVAILGAAGLFGVYRVSYLLGQIQARIRGRLLMFFPGDLRGNNYRLLDGRDGWNYMATAITASEDET
jgi:hypothetical protein